MRFLEAFVVAYLALVALFTVAVIVGGAASAVMDARARRQGFSDHIDLMVARALGGDR